MYLWRARYPYSRVLVQVLLRSNLLSDSSLSSLERLPALRLVDLTDNALDAEALTINLPQVGQPA
jgi:hypothetical protein